MDEHKFESIMNTVLSAILSLVLSLALLLKNNAFAWDAYIMSAIESFVVAYFLGSVIPAPRWGMALALKLGCKKDGFPAHLIRTAVLALCLIGCTSLILTFLKVGITPIFFNAWMSIFPLLLSVGYVGLLIAFPIVFRIAAKASIQPQKVD